MSAQKLRELIEVIEGKLQSLPPSPRSAEMTSYDRLESMRRQREATDAILMDLARWHGATFSGDKYDMNRMTLAGIKTSCTAGAHGLLTNWIAAARKRIASLEGPGA